jgi:hypothetical protein
MRVDQAPVPGDLLPPLYSRWVRALLPGGLPASDHFYSPDTKCCTFLPALPNFLTGRILVEEPPDPVAARGRATVEARIDKGLGVTPLGLERTAAFTAMYRLSPSAFGKAGAFRCPHYIPEDGGRCGVWRHRESTCATWFCKFDRGETGRAFWHRLHDLLGAAEMALARHSVLSLGIPAESLGRLFPAHARRTLSETHDGMSADDVDGTIDRRRYAAIWGPWLGREREFYRRSAALVETLEWRDVIALGGTELEVLARLTTEAYKSATSTELPPRLDRRQLKVVYTSATEARLVGYSNIDPLKAPSRLVEVLHCFDGRPTRDAIQRVADEHGLRVTDSLVRKLVDFGILGPAG